MAISTAQMHTLLLPGLRQTFGTFAAQWNTVFEPPPPKFPPEWKILYTQERWAAQHAQWLSQHKPSVIARIYKYNPEPTVPGQVMRGWRPKSGRAMQDELDIVSLREYEKKWNVWPEKNKYNARSFIKIGRRWYVTGVFYVEGPQAY